MRRNLRKGREKPAESEIYGEVQSPDSESPQTPMEETENNFGVK